MQNRYNDDNCGGLADQVGHARPQPSLHGSGRLQEAEPGQWCSTLWQSGQLHTSSVLCPWICSQLDPGHYPAHTSGMVIVEMSSFLMSSVLNNSI